MAIASMVIGIVAIVFSFIPFIGAVSLILGPLAVILGIVSLVKKRGKGQAIAGVITGAIGTLIALFIVIVLGAFFLAIQDELDNGVYEYYDSATETSVVEVDEVTTLSASTDQSGEVFSTNDDARIVYEFGAVEAV